MNRGDLADLNAFVAVADQRSFRAAASRRGGLNLGEFDDAVILKSFGDVPEDFRQV